MWDPPKLQPRFPGASPQLCRVSFRPLLHFWCIFVMMKTATPMSLAFLARENGSKPKHSQAVLQPAAKSLP